MVVIEVLYNIEEEAKTSQIGPNCFSLQVPEGSVRENRLPLKHLSDFPFDVSDCCVFVRQPDSEGKFLWLYVKKASDLVYVFDENVIFLKVIPSRKNCTMQLDAASSSNPWYESIPVKHKHKPARAGAKAAPPDPKPRREERSAFHSTISSVTSTVNTLSTKEVSASISSLGNKLTGWVSKGVQSATEAVGMSETITVGNQTVSVVKKLADGGFSEVFLVKDESGKKFALKRCLAHSRDDVVELKKEIYVHKAVKDFSHVLKLLGHEIVPSKRVPRAQEAHLLFPLYSHGSLFDHVAKPAFRFPQQSVIKLFQGICAGTAELHKLGFLHRDIKPHNVLLQVDGTLAQDLSNATPVLMDFGSCSKKQVVRSRKDALTLQDEAAVKCSAPYRAPELYDVPTDCVIGPAVDVWSLGCTLFAMSFGGGYPPFEDPVQGVLTLAILNATVKIPSNLRSANSGVEYSAPLAKVMKAMMARQPEQRPDLPAVMQQLRQL